ncbi:hypothetical protein [Aquihabitans sp. McL0605]|uniref:hypothetical protein n=1 Tax=Aquihabitans sp. McL0605 TaxID=3415671 RepID=UPI003CF1690F
MIEAKPGARVRSAVCDAEAVIVKAPAGDLDLRCGGAAMHGPDEAAADGAVLVAGFDTGCLIGKRYVDATGDIEVLCTKSGTSALSLGDEVLVLKDAKPLPSSD